MGSPDAYLEPAPWEVRRLLETEGKPIRHVHFPVDGVASVLASVISAETKIEVGTIGREGLVGLSLLFGATHAVSDSFVQVAGGAFRMPAPAFIEATRTFPALLAVLHRFPKPTWCRSPSAPRATAFTRSVSGVHVAPDDPGPGQR